MVAKATSLDVSDQFLHASESKEDHLIPIVQASNGGGVAYQVELSCKAPSLEMAIALQAFEKRSADRVATLSKNTDCCAILSGPLRTEAVAVKAKQHNDAVAGRLERYFQERQQHEHNLKARFALTAQSNQVSERAAKASQHNDMVAWRLNLHREQREMLMDVLSTRLESVTETVTSATERACKARQHNEMVTVKRHRHISESEANQQHLKARLTQKRHCTVADDRASKAAEHNEIVAWKVQNLSAVRSLRTHLLEAKLTQEPCPRAAAERALRARHHNEAVVRRS
jgi:hypothetical protein